MDNRATGKPPRPRGRPSKAKRVGHKPNLPLLVPRTQTTTSDAHYTGSAESHTKKASVTAHSKGQADVFTTIPARSTRSSPDTPEDEPVPPSKRQRTHRSHSLHTAVSLSAAPTTPNPLAPPERKARATMLPARRSTRHATVQATQISEGTLRPPGPPNLEAALNIALRNLESETWLYLWAYHKKHPGGPLPTPAAVKKASPRVRVAAEAVDEADRELEDAIDEIMLANMKQKPRVGARSTRPVQKPDGAASTDGGNLDSNFGRTGSISSVPEGDDATGTDPVNTNTGVGLSSSSNTTPEAASSAPPSQ